MPFLKQHIVYKIVTLLLIFALITPSFAKLSHAFNHHKHEICKGEYKSHLHTLDIDCEFYKFKLSSPFSIPNIISEIVLIDNNHNVISSQYFLLSEYQRLHFSLRGPPIFI